MLIRFLESEEKILRLASPIHYHKSPTRSQKADFSPPSKIVRETTTDAPERLGMRFIQDDDSRGPSVASVPMNSHESFIESWGLFKGPEEEIEISSRSPAILNGEENGEDLVLKDFI